MVNDIRKQLDTIAGEPSDWADAYNPLAGYEKLQRRHATACAQRRAEREEIEAPKREPAPKPEATSLTREQVRHALVQQRKAVAKFVTDVAKHLDAETEASLADLRQQIADLRIALDELRSDTLVENAAARGAVTKLRSKPDAA